ncbi:IS6 family transposase [Nitrosopumilus sp.]|uniref:IS6 family transposase n=1 Tax=Nitrosopumilus sp. TaxID=2024843 RepID=UPI00242D29F0|nr:IS6 family transposase [Nitrosopumilus sp.]
MNQRETKGKEIALKSDLIRVSDYHYHVHSQTTNRDYDVIKSDGIWHCDCPDHRFRKICCKHIHAIEFSLKIREEVRERNKVIIEPVSIDSCRFCKGKNLKKYGIRKNKHYAIQRFLCSDCHKTFSLNLGFEKMKHNPKGITTAMQLYFSGESLRNVSKSLKLLGMEVSHQTVYNWIERYTKLMEKYLEKITPQVGDAWRADEIYMKIKGDLKYVFAMMDDETRYLIAQEVGDRKEGHDARGLLRKSKEVTGTKPKVFITDGLESYHQAYKKEFWTVKRDTRTLHIKHIHLQGDMNNNKMERLNGEIRDREKVMRGLKKKDTPLLKGYEIFHNYFRTHSALDNMTPSEACGIEINGDNKWITLIQNASKN